VKAGIDRSADKTIVLKARMAKHSTEPLSSSSITSEVKLDRT
jgi:hypothetical protein